MNNTSTINDEPTTSNVIKAQPSGDYFQLLRDAIANGEYPRPATVDAAIDAILPIIVGDSTELRGVA